MNMDSVRFLTMGKHAQRILINHRRKVNEIHNKKNRQLKLTQDELRNSWLKQKEQKEIIVELIKAMSPDLQKKVVEQLCEEVA